MKQHRTTQVPARTETTGGSLRSVITRVRRRDYQPLPDYGVFGPDSVSWRVWTYPTTPTVAISRAVVIEELDPFLTATVNATGRIYNQPRVRLERTITYFATIAVGDSLSAAKAAETLTKVHAHAGCVEPVSGVWSDPNNPDQQLWILVTGWHSVLYAYETYGPGKLSEADERSYWADCAKAAEFQTIDPAAVPRTREQVRDYFRRMRPRLAASEATQHAMQHLMNAEVFLPELPRLLTPVKWPARFVLRAGVIRMLPRWQRDLANTHQSAVTDWLIRPILRVAMAVMARPRVAMLALRFLSPSTVPIAAPALLGIPPVSPQTVTPEQAFARHGIATPKALYEQFRSGQDIVMHRPSAPLPVPPSGGVSAPQPA
ncbi:oxygenase MpaB family protein [Mycobacterium sp. UM_Kg1]|uniref:oxygenase MpaB family protein n=1 Tax=Mycobacterium sp. UM_Kg1 TaxID=1545691 RepID=UPI00069855A0|nr:oxygenase MpaB family protein [Mycobacterium sp. UM_Kg1]